MRPRHIIPLFSLLASLVMASVASAQVSSGEFTYAVEIDGVVCGSTDARLSSVDGENGAYTRPDRPCRAGSRSTRPRPTRREVPGRG